MLSPLKPASTTKKGQVETFRRKRSNTRKNEQFEYIHTYIHIYIYEYKNIWYIYIYNYIYIYWPFPQTMPCGESVGFLRPLPPLGAGLRCITWKQVRSMVSWRHRRVLVIRACVNFSRAHVEENATKTCNKKCQVTMGSFFLLVATLERMWMVLHLNLADVWRICQGTAIAFPQLARCSNYNKVQLGSNKIGPLRTSEVSWNPRRMRA